MNEKRWPVRLCLWGAFICCIALCSCRFVAPSASDSKALMARGVFPSDVPAWVPQSEDQAPRMPGSSGFIPRNFSTPEAVKRTRLSVPGSDSPSDTLADRRAREQREKKAELEESTTEVEKSRQTEEEQVSPLARIEGACSGIEPAVVDALQTTDVDQRISKYKSLTTRCPTSWDLWLWLGKDYQSQGKLVEASRCYERVLTLDYSNEVARALLAVVRRRLNEGPSAADDELQ